MNVPGLDQLRDRLAAAGVLARRGMVDPVRPDQALRAFVAVRRYGAFGGLIAYTAARYGEAPAITDEDGTITFRELDETSNALARGLQAIGVRPGGVIGLLNRNHRSVMLTPDRTGCAFPRRLHRCGSARPGGSSPPDRYCATIQIACAAGLPRSTVVGPPSADSTATEIIPANSRRVSTRSRESRLMPMLSK